MQNHSFLQKKSKKKKKHDLALRFVLFRWFFGNLVTKTMLFLGFFGKLVILPKSRPKNVLALRTLLFDGFLAKSFVQQFWHQNRAFFAIFGQTRDFAKETA